MYENLLEITCRACCCMLAEDLVEQRSCKRMRWSAYKWPYSLRHTPQQRAIIPHCYVWAPSQGCRPTTTPLRQTLQREKPPQQQEKNSLKLSAEKQEKAVQPAGLYQTEVHTDQNIMLLLKLLESFQVSQLYRQKYRAISREAPVRVGNRMQRRHTVEALQISSRGRELHRLLPLRQEGKALKVGAQLKMHSRQVLSHTE